MLVTKSDNKLTDLAGKSETGVDDQKQNNLNEEKTLVLTSTATKNRFSPLCRQIIAVTGIILATVSGGMASGFSATLLPQLQRNDSEIYVTPEQASWIASITALPMPIGCILGGILMDKFGRKHAITYLNVPFVIGWILIPITHKLPVLLAGRFLLGICTGLLGPPSAVYIGESTAPKYRGFFLGAISLAIAIGILIVHLLGTFLTWKMTANVCAICPLLAFIFMSFAPESPSWLLLNRGVEESADSFIWLRGYDESARLEFEATVKSYDDGEIVKRNPYSPSLFKEQIRNPSFYRPLITVLIFFFTMQWAGVNAIVFYSIDILKNTVKTGFNQYLAMIIIDIVRLTMSFVACIAMMKCGRRPLAMISGVGTAVSLITLSCILFVNSFRPDLFEENVLVICILVLLISYMIFVTAGLTPIPWGLTGELFPMQVRGLGSAIVTSFNFICFFSVVKTGPTLFSEFGAQGTYLIYGMVALFGTIYLAIFLPETKNKTLKEIEEECIHGRNKKKVIGSNA